MRLERTKSELRTTLDGLRTAGRSIGLVPTMGALHDGHLSLVRRARGECDEVVMSLFLNPSQFAAGEDVAAYPRDEARDAELAARAGVDILFAPTVEEIYPAGFATTVSVDGLSERLCGARRGVAHFHGVATVVTKLFNIVAPEIAYFGEKDAQQGVVIRQLVRDLDIPVRIELCPTVREPDGLAMSSRNTYLSAADRTRAASLSRALGAAERAVLDGERTPDSIARAARDELARGGVEPEYLELVSPETLLPVDAVEGRVLVAVAARVGDARLIDNTIIDPRK